MNTKKKFTQIIIEWHSKENKRIMPWKGEKDPYKIWISEIILQQTRVAQGLAYYNNFIEKFPSLEMLALAPEKAVFKAWEGLGYYSRCRNLIHTAKEIFNEKGGAFPLKYEEILNLKGIGPYTAAAISSFAYGLPHAVADGNVLRVLSRFFGETTPVDSAGGKEQYSKLANQLLYKDDPAAYNQAIMDFGATVCKPQIPLCESCMLRQWCVAYQMGTVNELPVKEKKLKKSKRWFTYFVFIIDNEVLVKKRSEKDVWESLYEFYLFESDKQGEWEVERIEIFLGDQLGIREFLVEKISENFRQQLTHQTIEGPFIHIKLPAVPASLKHFTPIKKEDFQTYSFPRFINQYLETHPLFS